MTDRGKYENKNFRYRMKKYVLLLIRGNMSAIIMFMKIPSALKAYALTTCLDDKIPLPV